MILVVDDEPIYQKLIKNSLKGTGCEIDIAGDGYMAMEKIKQNRYLLAIIDLVLPGAINGMDVIRKLKKQNPETPIIVCSGYGGSSIQTRIEKAGANAFIFKPFTPEQMFAKVHSLLSDTIDFEKLKQAVEESQINPETIPDILENFPDNKINEILNLGTSFELIAPDKLSVNFTDSITIIMSGTVECLYQDKPIGELHVRESIGHESLMKNIEKDKQIELIAKSDVKLLVILKVEFLKYFCTQTNELLSILEKNIKKTLSKNIILISKIQSPPQKIKPSDSSNIKDDDIQDKNKKIDLLNI
ncbi:response regulator [candidate division KSB1 bacterium]|nr:response regulator [candidate division KSB1 bacterium]